MTTETPDVIAEVQRRLDAFHSPSFDREIVEQLLALARRSAASVEPAVADDTVFAWAWTLFGNGQIWQRRLTWTKDDPFAVDVGMSTGEGKFTSVGVPLYAAPSPSLVVSEEMVATFKRMLDWFGELPGPWPTECVKALNAALSPAPAAETTVGKTQAIDPHKDAGCGAERREDQPTVAPEAGWREAFDEMVATLKPFAKMAEHTEHTDVRDGQVVMRLGKTELRKADFRAARAAISKAADI